MYGGSLWQTLQRKRASEINNLSVDDTLEVSRRKNAEEAAKARAKLLLEKDRQIAAKAAATARQAELERLARKTGQNLTARKTADVFAAMSRAKDLRAACAWYYVDTAGKKQGPFSPKQMRDWFAAGYLPRELRVGPAFSDGRIPVQSDMERIDRLFDEPLSLTAFRFLQPGDTLAPAPKKQRVEQRKMPKQTGNWLQDSINRQKAGIHFRRHDHDEGPGMIFESHEA